MSDVLDELVSISAALGAPAHVERIDTRPDELARRKGFA